MMTAEAVPVWFIRNFDLFKNLPAVALEELAATASIAEFKRGDHVCASGQGQDRAYVIKEGNVRLLVHSPNGRRLNVAILKPGDVIGGGNLFGTDATGESAEAMSGCVLYSISLDLLKKYAIQYPEFALRITKEVNRHRTLIVNRMQDILFLTVPERLSRLLLRLADEFPGVTTSGKRFVNIRLTHQELADLIGSNREAVSAALVKLRRSKCVNSVQGYLVLVSEDTLRQTAYADAA